MNIVKKTTGFPIDRRFYYNATIEPLPNSSFYVP